MRARAKIVETKKRYEATISIDEIRKRFRVPEDAKVTMVVPEDALLGGDTEATDLHVSYERVK